MFYVKIVLTNQLPSRQRQISATKLITAEASFTVPYGDGTDSHGLQSGRPNHAFGTTVDILNSSEIVELISN